VTISDLPDQIEALRQFVVSGAVPPGGTPPDEENRQIHLNVRNQCLLADSYLEAGFTPVIDYILTSRSRLDEHRRHLEYFAPGHA
jgi:hypothetical protein